VIEFKSVILPADSNYVRPVVEIVYAVELSEDDDQENVITRSICNTKWMANIHPPVKDKPTDSKDS